ncbi:MAG: hypothetical protein ACUVUG_04825, partial [Candidatus Aminicenantia bacterium]
RQRETMILRLIIFSILISNFCFSSIYPQLGFESTAGSNNLLIFTPWIGIRYPLSSSSSLILKYYNHNLSFNYWIEDNKTKSTSNISNFTFVFYSQRGKTDIYSAVSYLFGTDSYKGIALDCGIEREYLEWLRLEGGFYLLKESSILWYPDEDVRDIFLYSLKGRLKAKFFKKIELGPNFYFYRNSEDVNAYGFSIVFTFSPKDPLFISISYSKYSESANYRFSGNYVSLGVNFYY